MTRSSTHPLLVYRPSLHPTRTETSVLDFCVDVQCARRPLLDTPVSTAVTGTWTAVMIGCSFNQAAHQGTLTTRASSTPRQTGEGLTDAVSRGEQPGEWRERRPKAIPNRADLGNGSVGRYYPSLCRLGWFPPRLAHKSYTGHGTRTPITVSTGGQRPSSRLRLGAKKSP